MRVFTRFLSIFLKEIDVLKAKTLKIFASGGSFLKEKKLTKSRYLNLKKEQNKGGGFLSFFFLEIPVMSPFFYLASNSSEKVIASRT